MKSKQPNPLKDIEKIINYFKYYPAQGEENIEALNKIFYYSLFDYSSIFDSGNFDTYKVLFPIEAMREYEKDMRHLLKKVFGKNNKFLKDFNDFELQYVSSDKLSRMILLAELDKQGVHVEPKIVESHGGFDLELTKDNTKIELKRVWAWTNFKRYVTHLCKKIRELNKTEKDAKYLFVVASPHPFIIETLFENRKEITIFNKYIHNIITSHYTSELLLKRYLQRENVNFIIQHINKCGHDNYNVETLSKEIKRKIS